MDLHSAEHHQAVEALRGAGAAVQMRLWRERMVEPENAVTLTPLRPEDDYSPRERRCGGPRPPPPESPGPLRQRHVACLVRSERGLGFSIAGGKGSTPYRAGDTVSGRGQAGAPGPARLLSCGTAASLPSAGHLHLPHRRGRRRPPGRHPAGRRPRPLGEWGLGPGPRCRPTACLLTAAPSQINGVDMTEARHDHAVSLLTAASPTIALLLEREAGAPLPPSPPPHSPAPPAAAPVADPGGPGPLRLAPGLLAAALEGPYPVEVSPRPLSPPPARPAAEVGGGSAPGRPPPGLPEAPPDPGRCLCPWAGREPRSCPAGRPAPPPALAPQEICLPRAGGPLGLSVVGGSDHSSHPFGAQEPGVFISKVGGPARGSGGRGGSRPGPDPHRPQVLPRGLAARSGLRVGDRILAVNGQDVRAATHQEAVGALLRPCLELALLVRRDPPPPGLRELCIQKAPGEKLGISVRGGAKGHAGNPCDPTDEGVFISKVRPAPGRDGRRGAGRQGRVLRRRPVPQVSPTGAAGRDGRLRVGLRLLEVNQQSLLGLTHAEAVQLLRQAGDSLTVLVCDGFDPPAEVSAGAAGWEPRSRPLPRPPRSWGAPQRRARRSGLPGAAGPLGSGPGLPPGQLGSDPGPAHRSPRPCRLALGTSSVAVPLCPAPMAQGRPRSLKGTTQARPLRQQGRGGVPGRQPGQPPGPPTRARSPPGVPGRHRQPLCWRQPPQQPGERLLHRPGAEPRRRQGQRRRRPAARGRGPRGAQGHRP